MDKIYRVPYIATLDTNKPHINEMQATIAGIFHIVANAIIYTRKSPFVKLDFADNLSNSLTRAFKKLEPTPYEPSAWDLTKTIINKVCKKRGYISQKATEHLNKEKRETAKRLDETFASIGIYADTQKQIITDLFFIAKDILRNTQRLIKHTEKLQYAIAKAEQNTLLICLNEFETIVNRMAPTTKGLLGFGPPTHMNTLQ
jgi:hypothetical protein